jgi:hypothetical protein
MIQHHQVLFFVTSVTAASIGGVPITWMASPRRVEIASAANAFAYTVPDLAKPLVPAIGSAISSRSKGA